MKNEWKYGKPLPGGRAINIHDFKLVKQAHHYVLQNIAIVQPYIEKCHVYMEIYYLFFTLNNVYTSHNLLVFTC